MPMVYELVDGPCSGKLQLGSGPVQDYIGFRVDKNAKLLKDNEQGESQIAFYRRDAAHSGNTLRYRFDRLRRLRVLVGGAMDGNVELLPGDSPWTIDGVCEKDGVRSFIVYELSGEDEQGRVKYTLREETRFDSDEGEGMQAIRRFYVAPDYSVYSLKPGTHNEVPVEVGDRKGSVDEGMAELIKAVWKSAWDTIGSCQELAGGESHLGWAYISFPFARHGHQFVDVLKTAGIEHETKEKKFGCSQRDEQGEPSDKKVIPGLSVFIHPADIANALEALAKQWAARA